MEKIALTWTCPDCGQVVALPSIDEAKETIDRHWPSCPKRERVVKRITDVLPPEDLKGNILTMEDVLDRDVLVKNMTFKDSTFKEDTIYLSLTIELDGEEFTLNTGAERVVAVFKLLKLADLPLFVSFEKIATKAGRRVYRVKV